MASDQELIEKIFDGLKKRGVTDQQIEQIREEFDDQSYDYDALKEDVSDREQSMLLDFFRDDVGDVTIFDKLLAAMKGDQPPVVPQAPIVVVKQAPDPVVVPKKKKSVVIAPPPIVNPSSGSGKKPKFKFNPKDDHASYYFRKEEFEGINDQDHDGTVILNPGLIVIPVEILLDRHGEFLEEIDGITYLLEYNNVRVRPSRLPFSYIKFWHDFLQEENPSYKQIADDISQNEGPTYDYLMENPPNDRILPVLEKVVDQLKYPKLKTVKNPNKGSNRDYVKKFFKTQTPDYSSNLDDNLVKTCILFKRNTNDHNFNVFELFVNVLDVYDRILYKYPGKQPNDITEYKSPSDDDNKDNDDNKSKPKKPKHFAWKLTDPDKQSLNATITLFKDPSKKSFFCKLIPKPSSNQLIQDDLRVYQHISLSFMLFIKSFMCSTGNYLEQGYYRRPQKKSKNKKSAQKVKMKLPKFVANPKPYKNKNGNPISDEDIFFHNDNMPLQFDLVIIPKKRSTPKQQNDQQPYYNLKSTDKYYVSSQSIKNTSLSMNSVAFDSQFTYSLYGQFVLLFRDCIANKLNKKTDPTTATTAATTGTTGTSSKRSGIDNKPRDDRFVIVINRKENKIYLFPPYIQNGKGQIDHRKKINVDSGNNNNNTTTSNNKDDKSSNTSNNSNNTAAKPTVSNAANDDNSNLISNKYSLISHEYNDITNWYLTSSCLIPSTKLDKYYGVNDFEFCLSAHYHKQRQWHRHPKLRIYQYFNGGSLRFFADDMTMWSTYFKDKSNSLNKDELQKTAIFDPILDLEQCDAQYVQWDAAVRRQIHKM